MEFFQKQNVDVHTVIWQTVVLPVTTNSLVIHIYCTEYQTLWLCYSISKIFNL
jgi:hypothetical protein